jgi:hypothetical protein
MQSTNVRQIKSALVEQAFLKSFYQLDCDRIVIKTHAKSLTHMVI